MSKLPHATHYGGDAARNVHASYSQDEIAKIDAAFNAWGVIRKTFYSWITLAEGVAVIRGKADSIGGRWTFKELLEEAGLGALAESKNKSTATRLVQINARRGEVIQWYENDLTEMQQARWAAPTSIFAHCPVFLKDKPAPDPSKPTLRTEVARLQEEADAANARARKAEQAVRKGSLFEFTDTAENIAKVFEQNASVSKIEDLIRELQAVVKRLKAQKTKPEAPADGGRTRLTEEIVAAFDAAFPEVELRIDRQSEVPHFWWRDGPALGTVIRALGTKGRSIKLERLEECPGCKGPVAVDAPETAIIDCPECGYHGGRPA